MTPVDEPPTAYVAARFGRMAEARKTAAVLEQAGIKVTASWLRGSADESSYPQDHYQEAAAADLRDIDGARFFVFLSEESQSRHGRGGRHVELGWALASGKTCIGIGPRENIFPFLPQVRFARDAAYAAAMLLEEGA